MADLADYISPVGPVTNAVNSAQRMALLMSQLRDANQKYKTGEITNQFLPDTLRSQTDYRNAMVNNSQMDIANNPLNQAYKQAQMQAMIQKMDMNSKGLTGRGGMFTSLPTLQKNAITAKMAGAGIDPSEGIARMNRGDTLQQIFKDHGADYNTVQAKYPATTAELTVGQNQARAEAEFGPLSKAVTEGISNYPGIEDTIKRQWYFDAKSTDPKKQAKALPFYVAHQLAIDVASGRAKQMGAQPGVALIENSKQLLQGHNNPDITLTPKPFQIKVQNEANRLIQEAANKGQQQVLSSNPGLYEGDASESQVALPLTQDQTKKLQVINTVMTMLPRDYSKLSPEKKAIALNRLTSDQLSQLKEAASYGFKY